MKRLTREEYLCSETLPIVTVVDNVRSLHNVGSIFRTADSLGLRRLVLCGITGTPPHPELHKSALGAEEVVEWVHYDRTADALRELRACGYTTLALEQAEGSLKLGETDLDAILAQAEGVALVLGNEVDGVSQEVIDLCDYCLEIRQYGTKHSMNVSVAGGIALWSLAHLFRKKQ